MKRRTFLKIAALASGASVIGADLVDTLLAVPEHFPALHWTGWKLDDNCFIYHMQGLWRSELKLWTGGELEHYWFVNLTISETQRISYWDAWDNAKRKNFMEGLLRNGVLSAQALMRKAEESHVLELRGDPHKVIPFKSIKWLPWPTAGEIVKQQYPVRLPLEALIL